MDDTPPLRACPVGCAERPTPLGELAVTLAARLSRTHYTLVRCGCGAMLYLSPAPTQRDLATMYVDEGQFGSEYTDEPRVRAILAYMNQALDRLERHRGGEPKRTLRVLEVGAGLAWMCRAAKERNRSSLTVAQDVSPEAIDRCPWVDHYVRAEVDDPRIAAHAPFDIVSMTHVIEHLVDPCDVVRRCRALMAADGLMFVTAPHRPRGWDDAAPDLARFAAYSYNHVPAHVQYFSERSLARLADASGCALVYWSQAHEGGEAFEAWLAPREGVASRSASDRAATWLRRMTERVARRFVRMPRIGDAERRR